MEDSPQRRRQRAYRMLREMPHQIRKPEAIRILDEAGCFDHDPHVERQYEDFVTSFHKVCRNTDDVQMDMIPLWRMERNGDGTEHKVFYLGKFGEMDADQHYQHLDGRRTQVEGDCKSFHYYLRRIPDAPVKREVQRRLEFGFMPPDLGPWPDDDDD